MKRRSKPRGHLVLKGWVEYLKRNYRIPDERGKLVRVLESEDKQDVLRLAEMLWGYGGGERLHDRSTDELDIYAYTHQELNALFGRSRFKQINSRVRMFDVWAESFGNGSQGSCRGYKLQQLPINMVRQYRRKNARQQTAPRVLIDGSGRKVNTLPQAIDPKRDDGSTARLWAGVSITNAVPVDVDLLYRAIAHYQKQLTGLNKGLFSDGLTDRKRIERVIDDAATIALLSDTEAAGSGMFPMRYVEKPSGRLYAKSDSLQNCVREVRKIALSGLFDLDIVNCHYALLAQMAADHGVQCPHLEWYASNADQVRQRLIIDTKLPRRVVKQCLLMLIYGAQRSTSPYGSLARAAGGSKQAEVLLKHEVFAAIAEEVARAGQTLVAHARKSARSGSIMNAAGCGLKVADKPRPKEIMAHLLQGAEALLLREAVGWLEEIEQGNVVLLQHDGLTVRNLPDMAALEAHLEERTGFSVRFNVEQLQPPPEGY